MSLFSRAYQLVLSSDFDTGFTEAQEARSDVDIRTKPSPLQNPEQLSWRGSREALTFHVADIASYVVRNGNEIDVHPEPGAKAWDVSYYLRASAMAGLLAQRGDVPLHASAVDTSQGAVLLISASGGGKSTFAAALRQKGFPILCDEMAILRSARGGVELIPDGPSVQLTGASMRHLGGNPADIVPFRPHLQRYNLWLPKSGMETPPKRPVRALIFLQLSHTVPQHQIEPVEAVSALFRLIHRLYRWRALLELGTPYNGPNGLRQTALEALVQTAQAYELTCPVGLDHLSDAVAALEKMLATPRPEPLHWSQQPRLPKIDVVDHWRLKHPVRSHLKPGFVALASFPKSGNTWVRALLTAWHNPAQQDTDITRFEGGGQMLESHTFEEEMGVRPSYIQSLEELANLRVRFHRRLFRYLSGPLYVKLHESSTRTADQTLLFPPDIMTGVILIVRNPLDVVGSYANHFGLTLDESVAALNRPKSWSHIPDLGQSADRLLHLTGSWTSHTLSWLDEPEHRVLLVRYEDLLANTLGEFRRILEFSGEPYNEALASQAVQLCRFDRLKAREKEQGFGERPAKSAGFFHKGKSGSWRETLPPELSRQICLDHGPLMRRLGYGNEVDEVLNPTQLEITSSSAPGEHLPHP